ncbi:MAG: tRNA-dihydrouridine synthase [Bdellovibrionales bacterium]|nr:tRNA-dihydrouridine synthase [Bdellovibrionales bacterium]
MKTEKLLKELKKNPFLLAPMAGVTDTPFRSFMREMGCGIVTTELVSAKSLQLKNERSYKLMSFTENQRPVGVQIFGEELKSLTEAAQIVEQSGADFVDLNFGCPVPKIVKKGAGSAVLKDLCFLQKILKTVKRSISIPLSIKVRTGWDQPSRNSHEVAKIAYNEGIIWLTVHGRTRVQAYSGQADWPYIKEIKSKSLIPIIGNGDLIKANQVLKLKKETGCDGMMIGRGCLKNPWIFQEINHYYKTENTESLGQHSPNTIEKTDTNPKNSYRASSGKKINNKNYINILNRLQSHLEKFYDEKMFLLQYKKFSTWFSSGYPDSARFRKTVFQTRDKKEVLKLINEYFHRVDFKKQQETPYEPALMQGHG